MNDDELLRNRAYRAEVALEEERRFCERCFDQHRYSLQTLHTKLAEVERERDDARAEAAHLRDLLDRTDGEAFQGRARAEAEVAALQRRLLTEPPYDGDLVSVLKERNRLANAEVAALREAYEKEKTYGIKRVRELLDELHEDKRNLAEARALLAEQQGIDAPDYPSLYGSWQKRVRAFLRRDEARRCTCHYGLHHEGLATVTPTPTQHAANCPSRDEARRCTCHEDSGLIGPDEHDIRCPARDEGKR